MATTDRPSWVEAYGREFDAYESCAKRLQQLIEDLLSEAGIDVVDVESRAKDLDSFLRKVEDKKDKYPKPLVDVTDLIGVRVIAYYLEDVDQIGEIIHREFLVDEKNSTDKLAELAPDQFGYRSIHYVVSLSDKRAKLAEWGLFNGRCAEIQLRTAAQHAWAAVEHKLSYKRTREAPRDIRRRLMRLSALFELADEQFSAVRNQLEGVEAQYSDDVKGGNLDLPVDKASLDAFLVDNDLAKSLISSAKTSGFILRPEDSDDYPLRRDIDLRDLVTVLDHVGVNTIAELHTLLDDDAVRTAIGQLGAASTAKEIRWGTPADVLCALILFLNPEDEELITSIYDASIIKFFEGARK